VIVQTDGKRNLSKHLNATETALAEKVRKCQEAKAQLDKAILDVDLELQNLTRTSGKLQKLLARRRAALELSERRLQVNGCNKCARGQPDRACGWPTTGLRESALWATTVPAHCHWMWALRCYHCVIKGCSAGEVKAA
jgi:hypothetical protein